jgi:hypothetical protein
MLVHLQDFFQKTTVNKQELSSQNIFGTPLLGGHLSIRDIKFEN